LYYRGKKLKEKPNYFVRVLIVLLAAALFTLVVLSFLYSEPKYSISSGILTLIFIITVVVLSESFNQLSIGKVLTLQKEVKEKEEIKNNIKEENKELRKELFSLISNIQQSQVNNTFNAPPESWFHLLGVVKAEKKPDDDQEDSEAEPKNNVGQGSQIETQANSKNRFQIRRIAEEIALAKYIKIQNIPQSELLTQVEFSSSFKGIDPIMDRRIIFDGYLRTSEFERFFEINVKNIVSPSFFDRLYIMLSKINLYSKTKNVHADLSLILVSMPDDFEETRPRSGGAERLIEYFQPAISNKLLRIEYISVSNEEISSYQKGGQQDLF
jgi:hypothetical protein